MSKPTLVLATQHLPCVSQTYGAQLRAYHTAKALQSFASIKLWVFPYAMVDPEDLQKTEAEFGSTRIAVVNQPAPSELGKTLSEHLDPRASKIGKTFPNQADQEAFLKDVDEAPVTWLHGLVIPNLFGRKIWPRTVIDVDDLRSQVWEGKFREARGAVEKFRARHQINLWKKREQSLSQRFPVITVCSEDDKDYLSLPAKHEPKVIPNGFQAPSENKPRTSAQHKRVGFIGTFNYLPNSKGVDWFLTEVWPLILKEVPDAEFRVVGSATEKLENSEKNIRGLGFVDDADAEMASWACSVVPILVGGGTRIKIAEAFSKRCPIVSTSLGAHGYRAKDGEQMRLVDEPSDFAAACVELLLNPEVGEQIAERGYREFEAHWDWQSIKPRMVEAAELAMNRPLS